MENIKSDDAEITIPGESILSSSEDQNLNQHIEKCLSMVLHHEQVQQIVDVIKKVQKEYISNKKEQD